MERFNLQSRVTALMLLGMLALADRSSFLAAATGSSLLADPVKSFTGEMVWRQLFNEPFEPAGQPTAEENRDLSLALKRFSQRPSRDDMTALGNATPSSTRW
jgi:hypothetical protein